MRLAVAQKCREIGRESSQELYRRRAGTGKPAVLSTPQLQPESTSMLEPSPECMRAELVSFWLVDGENCHEGSCHRFGRAHAGGQVSGVASAICRSAIG